MLAIAGLRHWVPIWSGRGTAERGIKIRTSAFTSPSREITMDSPKASAPTMNFHAGVAGKAIPLVLTKRCFLIQKANVAEGQRRTCIRQRMASLHALRSRLRMVLPVARCWPWRGEFISRLSQKRLTTDEGSISQTRPFSPAPPLEVYPIDELDNGQMWRKGRPPGPITRNCRSYFDLG